MHVILAIGIESESMLKENVGKEQRNLNEEEANQQTNKTEKGIIGYSALMARE